MRPYDFSPVYRNFVGFDRMANMIESAASQAAKSNSSYPPTMLRVCPRTIIKSNSLSQALLPT